MDAVLEASPCEALSQYDCDGQGLQKSFVVELIKRKDLPPVHLRIVLDILPITLKERGRTLLMNARSEKIPEQAIHYIEFLLNDFY